MWILIRDCNVDRELKMNDCKNYSISRSNNYITRLRILPLCGEKNI